MTESEPKWQRDLASALRSAHAPAPISTARHEQILLSALEDPLAPPSEAELQQAEALRQALAGNGDSPDAALAQALRRAMDGSPASAAPDASARALERALPKSRGNVIFVAFGIAASTLAAAAAIALVLGPLTRASAPEASSQRVLVPSRSFAATLDADAARLSASARMDRMAQARERDLRSNRYAAWGVR